MAVLTTETTIQRATGAAAIAVTVAPGKAWQLREIRVHLSAAGGAGNLTATIDNGTAAAYDTVVLTQDMTSVVDLEWQPDFPMSFASGDELDIAWANASTRTYGIEIIYSPVY
jgi:hypothetical protein